MAEVAGVTPAASPGAVPAGPARRRTLALIAGGGLFALAGAAGFGAVRWGMPGTAATGPAAGGDSPSPPGAYVPVEALTINLGPEAGGRMLRFRTQLEVAPALAGEVAAAMPRIVDVLNGYLRAVEVADLEDRSALLRLRAQMLHRVQMVAGPGRVRDLLVMEFVLN